MNNVKTYKKRLYIVSFQKLNGTIKNTHVVADRLSEVAQEFADGVVVNGENWSLYGIEKVSKSFVNVIGEMVSLRPFRYVGE